MLRFWIPFYWVLIILMIIFGAGLVIVKLRFKKHYQKYHRK